MTCLGLLILLTIPTADRWPLWVSDRCHSIEINTYGPENDQRTALLFRDAAGSIVDWRWWSKKQRILGKVIHWTEKGHDRIVTFKYIRRTRTLRDVELAERQKYPMHQRRGICRKK